MSLSRGYEVRSKSAGPFWLTFDIFCANAEVYHQLSHEPLLAEAAMADLMHADPQQVKVFHLDALNVIKISLPRPVVQGSVHDRDMHGAQWGNVLTDVLVRAGV
jgi:hypothetical protein